MSADFKVTAPLNGWAVAVYALNVFLAAENLVGIAESKAMKEQFGVTVVTFWAVVTLVSALVCLAAIFTADERLVASLWVEMIAVIVFGLTALFYEITLFLSNGFTVMITQTMASMFVLGSALRARQINKELKSLRVRARNAVRGV